MSQRDLRYSLPTALLFLSHLKDPMRKTLAIAAVAALTTAVNTADAQLLTFDDIPQCDATSDDGVTLPSPYMGFVWSNFAIQHMLGTDLESSGYSTGVVTPGCTAFNAYGYSTAISSATSFTFNGGFFTSAWNDELTLTITGFDDALEKYSASLNLDTHGPQLFNVNWEGINRLEFSASSRGSENRTHFTMDNARFNNAYDPAVVPEPSSLILLAGGLAALGIIRRRRARTT